MNRPTWMVSCLTLALVILTWAAPAEAIDAWRDRRGLFAGLSFGGGQAASTFTNSDTEDRTRMGLVFGGKIGGGITKWLTADLELLCWTRSEEVENTSTSSTHLSTFLAGNLFLLDGIYLKGGGGLAQAWLETYNKTDKGLSERSDLGWGFMAGLGYEFFVNADLALSVNCDFHQHHIPELMTFRSFNVFAGATWY